MSYELLWRMQLVGPGNHVVPNGSTVLIQMYGVDGVEGRQSDRSLVAQNALDLKLRELEHDWRLNA